jgi:hypothetical protein
LVPENETISYTVNVNLFDDNGTQALLEECDGSCAGSFMEELNIYKAEDKCPFFESTFDKFNLENSYFLEKCIRSVWRPQHGGTKIPEF